MHPYSDIAGMLAITREKDILCLEDVDYLLFPEGRREGRMYGHQFIEDFKYLQKRTAKDHLYVEKMGAVLEGVRDAQHFYLGSYEELIQPLQAFRDRAREVPLFMGDCSTHIRLPYKMCWFEFDDHSFVPGKTSAVPKRGLFVIEMRSDLILVHIANWLPEYGRWTLGPLHYIISIGKTFGEDPKLRVAILEQVMAQTGDLDIVNSYMDSNVYPLTSISTTSPSDYHGLREDDQRDLFVLNSALMLLNCKNIGTEDNEPPEKLNKKRKKKKKQQLFSYKTLVLTLPSDRSERADPSSPSDIKHRIHLCRGHFKLYSEAAPLFGQHTGLYWWDAHLRGDKKEGLVVKDYKVKVKEG